MFPRAVFTPTVQPHLRATGEQVLAALHKQGVVLIDFGLALTGYERLTNYDGSWNEWGARDDWPTEGSAQRVVSPHLLATSQ